jgi:hypothetical protein
MQREIGQLAGRHREQAHSYSWIVSNPLEIGRLSGRHRWQASSHNWIGCMQVEIGRLSGRHREQAHSYRRARADRFCSSPLNRMSVSSAAAFDLDLKARRQAEWRD